MAHPEIGLFADPVGSEHRREAVTANDELAGHDPLGAEAGGGACSGLDQRPVGVERAEHRCEMQ
jgi:hypothetical protein